MKDFGLLIGAHESISGGLWRAAERAAEDGCEVIQIFSGSPNRWDVPEVARDEADRFREGIQMAGISGVLVHGSYLINPASPDRGLWERSRESMIREYGRCRMINADYLVVHPGSHRGQGAEGGVERAAELFRAVLDEATEGPMILLENTAGSGNVLGGTFSELRLIRRETGCPDRMGYCFDTAHAFASGYDITGEDGFRRVMEVVDKEAGLDLVKAFHLNDTARGLGSRVDRHARIGEGILGLSTFARFLGDLLFEEIPAVLETQPLPVPHGKYRDQVDMLKELREKNRESRRRSKTKTK